MTESWIDFTLNAIVGATAFLCLFDGIRRLGIYGLRRKAALMTVVAASICALYGSFAYLKYQDLKSRLAVAQTRAAPSQLPGKFGRTSSPEKKETFNLSRARDAFVESGKLGSYADRSGESRTFAPGQEDLARRERVVTYYAQLESTARESLGEALLWLIIGLVAAIFGFAVSFDKVRPPSGSGVAHSSP